MRENHNLRLTTAIVITITVCGGMFFPVSGTEAVADFKTPEKFTHLPSESIRKVLPQAFHRSIVDDKDAVTGKAVRFSSFKPEEDKKIHAASAVKGLNKFIISLSNMTDRKHYWQGIKIPQDEKYHWYCIRNCKFGPKTLFWGWMEYTACNLSQFYNEGVDNDWDVWFSIKVVGPSYVKGSKQENNFFLDCIILTKPGAVK